jgi:hypothetical protein
MRLHLIELLLRPSFLSPKEFHIPLLPFSLSHHVETNSSPTKHTVFTLGTSTLGHASQYTWVEMPGSAPGSTMPLLRRNYNNIVIIRHTYLCVNQIRPTTTFRERGNYSTNKKTTATMITPMAKL